MALIHIVDDETYIANAQSMLLRSFGYDTAVVYSVEQALDYLAKNVPDCVVSDGNMNGRHGIEILDCIETDERLKKVGFVMVSAHARLEVRDKLCKSQREFLDKTASIDGLVQAVQRQISLRQQQ